jgi:hypothetical protein
VQSLAGRSDNHDEEDPLNENFDDVSMQSVVPLLTVDDENLSR